MDRASWPTSLSKETKNYLSYIRKVFQEHVTEKYKHGAWVAQSDKHLTLDLCSSHYLTVEIEHPPIRGP